MNTVRRFTFVLAAGMLLLVAAALQAQTPSAGTAVFAPPEAIHVVGFGGTFLGVGVQEIDAERSRALKLREEYGVEITRVEEDSPASKAGLKVGDVVLEYNGQRVEGTEQFVRFVRETPAGRTVKLAVVRGGSPQTVLATLAARKSKTITAMPGENFHFDMPNFEFSMPDVPKAMMSWRSSSLGVEAEALGDSQLAAYFGVKEGVLVRSVIKGTAAEKAGLKAGDVLLKVDETKVGTPREVSSAIRTVRSASKRTFPLMLMREKREMNLSVTLEEDTSEHSVAPRGRRVTVRPE